MTVVVPDGVGLILVLLVQVLIASVLHLVVDVIHHLLDGVPVVDLVSNIVQIEGVRVVVIVVRSQNAGGVVGHDDQLFVSILVLVIVVVSIVLVSVGQLEVHGHVHNVSGVELGWEDFVEGWQDEVVEVTVVGDEQRHQVPELVFIDVAASPDKVHGNGVPVLHGVEEVEQGLGGDDVAFAEQGESLVALQEPAVLEQSHDVVNFVQILVVILVVQADGVRVLQEVFVLDVLLKVVQEVQNELLMLAIPVGQLLAVVHVVDVPIASHDSCNEQRNHENGSHL